MRVAVVGSGVSGLVCAHLLHPADEVTVYEADDRIGGHVNTVEVPTTTGAVAVDTGFIVFNEPNYPGFTRLLRRLGVDSQPSDMSFSMSCSATGIEYRGSNLNTLFSRRSNAASRGFLGMLRDIRRFNRDARLLLDDDDLTTSLSDFLAERRYSRGFVEHYLVPLGASIWSADPTTFTAFPAASLARFFERHGLLSLGARPQWRTVVGGSARYVEALVAPMTGRFRTSSPVRRVERDQAGVTVLADGDEPRHYDKVVFACHADQALSILGSEATRLEGELLGTFRYQLNRATLHTDTTLLPRRRRAWASWNYQHVTDAEHRHEVEHASVTYHANQLQDLDTPETFMTTLNREHSIDPAQVLATFDYTHPVFDAAAMESQRRHDELNGGLHTYFCGAYWGYGFHEDGVQSALRVARHFNREL